jgi:alpha-ribazole phosphatase
MLWLARHAQPLLAAGICYGALDVAADAEHTRAAAQGLAAVLPHGMAVQVSPLLRCQQLATCLQDLRADLRVGTDARLREMDFGCWEGVAWSAIPRAAVDAWTADFAQHRFGGKESASEVLARVASVWDAWQPAGALLQDVLWISHAGVAQAVTLLSRGVRHIERADEWPVSRLAYGEWMRL